MGRKTMKILRLDIKGFRSLKDISWAPGDLNVVIGPNGTGKSNLLRMLQLISVSAQGRLGKYIQKSGGMEPLVWDGISDSICFDIKSSQLLPFWSTERNWLTYGIELSRLGKSGTYSVGREKLLYFHRNKPKGNSSPPASLKTQPPAHRAYAPEGGRRGCFFIAFR